MLFNSYEFLFVFLPPVICLFFLFNHRGLTGAAKAILLLASWFFYAWWNPVYLPLLLGSITGNYLVARLIRGCRADQPRRRLHLMQLGVMFNVGLLGYFKYMDFFLANLNWLGFDVPLLHLALPLAISFFSLQQIAFIVDAYRGVDTRGSALDYGVFVSFFPQLIAGPIVHHREVIPQLKDAGKQRFSYDNACLGMYLFAMGLFKKVVVADTFALWASNGFDGATELSMIEAWIVSYSYTLQLYFDFSGYSDMALGLALLFNIRLPQNFNSPYRATSIINLWQRWHLTLTRFINMYIYKPVLRALPRVNFVNGMIASFVAMMIAGVWHGAAWTFVVFGALQGVAIIINHVWRKWGVTMPAFLGWLITFHFFSFSLVIFRAVEWSDIGKVYRGMLGMTGVTGNISLPKIYGDQGFWFFSYAADAAARTTLATWTCLLMVALFLLQVTLTPNSNQWAERFRPSPRYLLALLLLFIPPVMMLSNPSEFIYFQF
jgi:D-alanyl-lipoteichoic acid acyltransferase DltB (MBOAT superfamily)